MPGTDNYLVSTVEDNVNQVAVYRKNLFEEDLGPFANAVLDLWVMDGKVFLPQEMIIERLEVFWDYFKLQKH